MDEKVIYPKKTGLARLRIELFNLIKHSNEWDFLCGNNFANPVERPIQKISDIPEKLYDFSELTMYLYNEAMTNWEHYHPGNSRVNPLFVGKEKEIKNRWKTLIREISELEE